MQLINSIILSEHNYEHEFLTPGNIDQAVYKPDGEERQQNINNVAFPTGDDPGKAIVA